MKYQWVRQLSGEDCGAASLAIVCRHYGRSLRIHRIRECVGTGAGGTTLLGIKRGAETLGFETQAIKATPEILDELSALPLPALLYWKGYHFVAFYGQQGKKYVLSDPALGIRYLTRQELLKGWQGCIMLLLRPTETFFAQPNDPDDRSPFASLTQRLRPQRLLLTQLIALNLTLGLLALSTPLLLQFLTDRVLANDNAQLLTPVAIGVIVLALCSSGVSWLQSNLVATFAERLQKGLKLDFAQQVLHLPLSYHEARRSGTAIRRLSDIAEINLVISQLVIDLPIKAFTGLVALGFMATYSWQLSLIIIAIAILMTLTTALFQSRIRQATYQSFAVSGDNAGILSEAFTGALTLKSTAAAPQLWQELQHRLTQETKFNLKANRLAIANTVLTNTLGTIGTVILLWCGSLFVLNRALSVGQLIAIYGLKESFLVFVASLVGLITNFTRVKTITQMLTELFEHYPENQGDELKPALTLSAIDDITCTKLNFQHPGRIKLLNNLSLTIPGGKVTALIGQSGCGKSTLSKLLNGLYRAQSGEIFVGHISISDLPLHDLRQQVVLVPQDAFFFRRSIIENFRLSKPIATIEEIQIACKIAGADEFVQQFPEKYETILGAVAANVSGGQKQRLAIARAILTDPPVLILDESTANLDPISESEILERLLAHRQGKTTILISHRPKVIQCADWIVQLNQGSLGFQGSIQEFRDQGGEHLKFLVP